MSKKIIQKNIKLSGEFDQYISDSSTAFRRIPDGAYIVITSERDKALSEANISMARSSKSSNFVEAHKAHGKWEIKAFKK